MIDISRVGYDVLYNFERHYGYIITRLSFEISSKLVMVGRLKDDRQKLGGYQSVAV